MAVDPLVSVGIVLLLLLAVLSWLTRRIPAGSLGAATKERVKLTPQHSVHLVEVAGLRLLVGTGPSGAPQVLARLGEIEAPSTAPVPEAAPLFPRSIGALFNLGRLGAAR